MRIQSFDMQVRRRARHQGREREDRQGQGFKRGQGEDRGRGRKGGIGKQHVSTLVVHRLGAFTSHHSDQPSAV